MASAAPRYDVNIGPAVLEPVATPKNYFGPVLAGVSLLAAVLIFTGTLRLGSKG